MAQENGLGSLDSGLEIDLGSGLEIDLGSGLESGEWPGDRSGEWPGDRSGEWTGEWPGSGLWRGLGTRPEFLNFSVRQAMQFL